MLALRPYQRECIDVIKKLYQEGKNRQLISLPTGSGKTVIFAYLIKELGLRALVLAHTNELLQQAKDKIAMVCPSLGIGIVNGYSKEFDAPVVVSSIQSAKVDKNLEELKNQGFELLIYDESHHAAANTPRLVLNELGFGSGTSRLLCGFSATAFRNDDLGLAEVFDIISYEKTTKEMIEEGYLCRPNGIKIVTDLDLSKVKTSDGDFQITSLSEVMNTPEINQLVVDPFLKEGGERKAICFGVTVQHACNLAYLFRKHGIHAQAIYGEMPKQERAAILKDYQEGYIQVLCNCQILCEGFDAPETSCVIIARPTKSRGLYQQMVGRGLRLAPNKADCLVLDFCDRNHTLCNVAMLLEDTEYLQKQERKARKKELLASLPPNLNQRLKSEYFNLNLLGDQFVWKKEENGYSMRGSGGERLSIVLKSEDRYRVLLTTNSGDKLIGDDLNFSYAFSTAEDFARANRNTFIVSDREAQWRDLSITENQLFLLKSFGFRAGLERLTRGQASDLIGSGAIRRVG